ncbi:hypothetical protein COCVIDRAFT_25185 [Bipolaris victoriae FI3]|uniref:MARVEL domain-containing protein n=1 Tax=Bipolaris victoriae (strain FI3) TaxID=930091 RepID=W7EKY1_BIPV3|nr:hypothetical protein COCVIDRAFT_25185 [Bipolaris victoriae FI3]
MVIPSVQQAQATPSAVLVTADQVTAGPVTAEVEEASSKRFIAELLTHGLHLVSSIVVLGIVIYLIYVYTHTGLEMFLSMLASVDIVVCIFALCHLFHKSSTPDLTIPMFILSSLWLTAFILSSVEYAHEPCIQTEEEEWVSCPIKRAHMAFEAIAFFLSFATMMVEIRRWRGNKGDVEVVDGGDKGVGNAVVTPGTSNTAV